MLTLHNLQIGLENALFFMLAIQQVYHFHAADVVPGKDKG